MVDPEQVYRRSACDLQRQVASIVGWQDAEDGCAHAWAQLTRYARKIDPGTVFGWLFVVALRHAHRQMSHPAVAIPESIVSGPGTVVLVERREQLRLVDGLPVRQRRIVLLNAFGLTYVEIAEQTGDTPRTVERLLFRGRRRLREAVAVG